MLLKSEAIIHPDDVVKYISAEECQLSYNPLMMALLWNMLATRQVDLLAQALASCHHLPRGSAWVNYVRCHDDIGWTFSDEDASKLGINGADHRRFLNEFYRCRLTGSFARGLPFQKNPKTGDCRISGTCASLAGLEKALTEEGQQEVELAIRRIALIHRVVLTAGGIPLLYLGDEVATLNDYTYLDDPAHKNDSRWVHRPKADPDRYAQRLDPNTIPGRVYASLRSLIALRKSHPEFAGGALQVIDTYNPHALAYARSESSDQRLVVVANFSEREQVLPAVVSQQSNLPVKPRPIGQAEFLADCSLRLPPMDFAVFG